MRNFTIFKTGSQRGVNTFMLEGASVEHPLSTRSASDGTSRKPAGNTAIIRCMAAMFVMLFILCAGNAWGANYIEFTAVVKCFNGATGQVLVKSGGGSTTSTTVTSTSSLSGGSGWSGSANNSNAVFTYNNGGATSKYTWGALAGEGSEFEGWYTDAECTAAAPTAFNSARRSSEKVVYVIEGSSVSGYTSATSDANRCHYTLYAKFTKEASGNKFKPQLTATSSNFSQGHIAISMTSTGSLSKVAQTAGPVDYTLTEESSLSQTFSVRAQPMRGYKFVNWTVAGNPRTTDKATSDLPLESFTVTLTDEMTPGANSVISNNDVVTANFEADALKDFKIQKEANTGSVSGSYTYYYIISGGNSTTHTDPISSLALADTEKGYQLYGTDKITLTATPAAGYNFSGWYVRGESHPDELLTTNATLETYLTEDNLTFVPVFALDISGLVIGENDNFLVGYSTCTTLEQAISAATQSQHKTILQLKDYTVPAGNYTIPADVTLLIPYAEDQSIPAIVLPRVENQNATDGTEYRRLTLSSGVHLEVYGTIEVSGQQATGVNAAGGEVGIGCPTGGYGCMYMGAGSSITLNNGALLRGWGFVLGDIVDGKYQCEIDARRGSIVREQFQIMDWKGGTYTFGMTDGLNSGTADDAHRVLPINQYYIQNVEVPVKFRPGAKLQANASVFLNGKINVGGHEFNFENMTFNIDNVGVIGAKYFNSQDAAIFLMNDEDDSEDTWVRKYYDVAKDQQVYEINNSAYLGSLELTMLGVTVSSTEYKLPITNNMKIHLLNGNMEITQHTEFLAGSELMMNKKSTVTIPSGVNVYLYDKEEWGNYISATRNENMTFTMRNGTTVRWRPGGRPTIRRDAMGAVKIEDTKFTVSGTLDVQGKLFTTTNGATIISSVEDAGTVMFSADAPANFTVSQITSLPADASHSNAYTRIECTSAQLQNEDGSLAQTYTDADHHAVSGQSYCFIDFDGDGDGEWKSLTTAGCFVKDENDVYYIKPGAYVAISTGTPAEESDHTYRTSGRIFILAAEGECQWWEVEAVEGQTNLFHCIHPLNNTYYYYSTDDEWKEKKFKVSWVNWDGSPVNYTNFDDEVVNYYMVSYGTIPQWLSANPTRANDASHEYSFDKWSPDLAPVTADVTYMATYEERDRMYQITFNNESDELIQVLYCKLGEMPVCDKYDAAANNKEWTPALGAVAGNQVYKLQAKNVEGPFIIRFVNWDGEELLAYDQEEGEYAKIALGSTPVYNGATPIKPADDSHTYTFVGWTPGIGPATQNMTYTAKFDVQQLAGLNVVDAQTITTDLVIPDVRITATGSLNVTGSITANNFYLESNGSSASGQIIGGYANIDADHIYFDYKVNAKNHKWYGVAVPWQVDATSGISVNGRTLELGKDFDIIYYDGARRAEEGKQKCWQYVQNDVDKILVPGRLYLIGLMMDAPQGIRFAKKSGTDLLTTSTSVTAYSGAAASTDQGWNGVANPALFHAFVNAGSTIGQVYNPETGSYSTINMDDAKMVVGQGAFVQAPADKTINVTSGGAYAAPRRATAEKAPLMDVRIAPADAEYTDRLFVTVDEEKEETGYVVGKDLAKLGVSKQVAQMWINRYDAQLCLNTVVPVNGVAEYPLGIFAPTAGEYMISSQNDEFTIYLTRNGRVIWNLSMAPYTATMEQGTTTTYGLRLIVNAPQTPTGMDEALIDAQGETRKVLINNQVFIIRGNNVYTVDGRLVK